MNNKKPFFSIIIPIYNVEKYIAFCLETIFCQTYSSYEIIIINDGSTDRSYSICKKIQESHPNIKLIEQPNSGAAVARNLGIKNAIGKYLVFMDGDDYFIASNFLQYIWENTNDDPDLISFSYNKVYQNIKPKEVEFDSQRVKDKYNIKWNKDIPQGACSAIVKRSVILNNEINFPEGVTGEDIIWAIKCWDLCDSIRVVSGEVYAYRQNNVNSVTSQNRISGIKGYLLALNFWLTQPVLNLAKKNSINYFLAKCYLILLLNYSCQKKLAKSLKTQIKEKKIILKLAHKPLLFYLITFIGIDNSAYIIRILYNLRNLRYHKKNK